MKTKKLKKYLSIIIALFVCTQGVALFGQERSFTIVIDAGHGGHDAGAIGRFSKEKNINLSVALKFGNKIKRKYPDVKVIYTRTKDVFITLQERANIANRNHANIFFSIHTNSVRSSTPYGTETYVLGLAKSKTNLEVAMKENSVITLEDDYKTKYEGFNPNSIDSYIMFEYMQDKYLDKSVQLASLIESQFKKTGRYSRGVRQAGFWVLHKSACPSVLVELGFISNRAEERFLNSNIGQENMANAMFNAFENYKSEHDKKNNTKPADVKPFKADKQEKTDSSKITYKIQLFALERRITPNHPGFKGLENVDYYKEGNLYKYTYGEAESFEAIEKIRKEIAAKFPKAYIIVFKGDNKITIGEALKIK